MLKLRPNVMREPYGGHHFTEKGVTFKGETKDEVVKKLTEFRSQNHLVVGNPDQDVLMFYLTNWPWLVESDHKPEETTEDLHYVKWREWVQRLWTRPPTKHIATKEASGRWDTCAECPFNKQKTWKVSDESKDVERQVFMLKRGIKTPSTLGYCTLHQADLSVFSFIDNPGVFSAATKDSGSYEKCWVRSFAETK